MSLNHIFDKETAKGDSSEVYSNELNTFNGLTFFNETLGPNQGRITTLQVPDAYGTKNYITFRNEVAPSPINACAQKLYINLDDITIQDNVSEAIDLLTYNNYVGFPILREANITRPGANFKIWFCGTLDLKSPGQQLEITIGIGEAVVVQEILSLPNQAGITPFRFNIEQIIRKIGPPGTAEMFSAADFSTIDSQGNSQVFFLDSVNNTTYETVNAVFGFVRLRWVTQNAGNVVIVKNLMAFGTP